MYERYGTESIVLGSAPRGEADKTLWLFTREFGLVVAKAISLRAEKSKLRYAVQDLSHVHVELIRAKHDWRLAGARTHELFWQGSDAGLQGFARVARLMRRLIAVEDPHEKLFDTLVGARKSFECTERESLPLTELLAVARILHVLGYVAPDTVRSPLFAALEWDEATHQEAAREREWLRSAVNRAISEAHR